MKNKYLLLILFSFCFLLYGCKFECETCNGKGKNKCTECQGGHFECNTCEGSGTSEIQCAICNGSGVKDCASCEGYKNLMCHFCSGTGQIETIVQIDDVTGEVFDPANSTWYHNESTFSSCNNCNGAGGLRCDLCQGSGTADCKECNSGYKYCEDCNGYGKFLCPTCYGETTVKCRDCYGYGEK
ncbi:hypothetical protein LNP27_02365 [Flavobacterium galactosidilyticum]|uniref:hypothetical protein n=1 Tax=Flavobacterium galactosidilyticum TaxID=2893886 RepID=UPI001E2E04FD|nr:hypothetical protein [Flavobacterium sp. F-340]UFH46897.1 hypothetical protein LNP27_02365 [Flavobacterium sp. F-340]